MKKPMLIALIVLLDIIIILLCLFLMKGKDDNLNSISGIFYSKNWNESAGTYNGDTVPDEKTALKIAKAVFDGMDKSGKALKYTPQEIFFDTEDQIWIVSFWETTKDTNLGDCCSIAIQKSDGKILRIWYGE